MKNLDVDESDERVNASPPTLEPCRSENLAAFLPLRNDVDEAMKAGYSMTTIWEYLHDEKKIAFSYGTFLLYVRRHPSPGP